MKVKTVFFALYRDLFGTDELELELPDRATVADLTSAVRRLAKGSALPDFLVVAVNQEYATPDRQLRDGDEVAFVPPVAGG